MTETLDLDYQQLAMQQDALEQHRQEDVKSVEEILKNHEILGDFFTDNWEAFKHYVRVEEYHKDVQFIKHEQESRKVYILLEGEVSAFVLTNKTPKPYKVYNFSKLHILTEVSALFGGRRHYGFITESDCKLVSLDLDYIEDEVEEENSQAYVDLIDILYPESGKFTAEICNNALIQKLDLRDMLGKHNFFANIDKLDEDQLNRLAENMKYIFLPSNTVLVDETNKDNIYIIESGTVTQTKEYKEFNKSDSYIYTRSLESIYVNDQQHDLQKVFQEHIEIEDQLNSFSDFDCALGDKSKIYRTSPSELVKNNTGEAYKSISITEDINRYGIVGEDNLSDFEDTKVSAVTKTHCCLIEINRDRILQRDSVVGQIVGFFNNKVNDMQTQIIKKQEYELNVKNRYIALVNFSFLFMVVMAVLGISGRLHDIFNFVTHAAIVHRFMPLLAACFILSLLLKRLNFPLDYFGLTRENLKPSLTKAVAAAIFAIFIVTGAKDIYIYFHAYQHGVELFQPDLVINDNLNVVEYGLFLFIYVLYIFFYELCARGLLQNIFSFMLTGRGKIQYWGSIFAASLISSQFHMSLFHEFSMVLFAGNIVAGIVYANTRNLWAAFAFHTLFSVYLLTILGLLPGSHY